MSYESKIDAWLAALVGAAICMTIFSGFTAGSSDTEALVSSVVALIVMVTIIGGLAYPCRYVLEPDHLLISSGLLFRQRIAYREITGVEPSSNPFAAPALSLRRVKITYGRRYQLVSPRERDEFIAALRARARLAHAPAAPFDSFE